MYLAILLDFVRFHDKYIRSFLIRIDVYLIFLLKENTRDIQKVMPARSEHGDTDTKWNETLGIKNIWVSTHTAANSREKDHFSTEKCGSEHEATSESIR